MEKYHIKVEKYKFIGNEEYKFINTVKQTGLYIILSEHLIEDPYKYIFDLIKKDIGNDADEVVIRISRKEE